MQKKDEELDLPGEGWHVTRHRVIYGDTDAMGIVYYANYLRFFEIARNEHFRSLGATYESMERVGIMLPVIEANARYRLPARYDDELAIATQVERLGACRVRFAYRLFRAADGVLLTEGFTVHACVSRRTGKAMRLPSELHAVLRRRASGGTGGDGCA